ncbi:Polysaccharide lyase family 1 protein, partial [Rhizoctonia solani]
GIHTRSYGQVLAQANVFINVTEPISSYGFVIPDDSPDDPKGDYEPDGYANESNNLYISSGPNNITRTGTFTTVPYSFPTDAPSSLKAIVDKYSELLNTLLQFTSPIIQITHENLSHISGYSMLAGDNITYKGTTGGAGGAVVNVTTRDELLAAVKGHLPKIVYVLGNVGGNTTTRMSVGNNTSIIGVGKSAIIEGGGFSVNKASNVIIRNLIIRKVVNNDGITVIQSNNVWIDHNEFYSDTEHGFDYYDGQVDITRGSDYVTVSWNKFHDHYKSSLIGSSEKNGDEDTGHFKITYHHNSWNNVHTRTPALRFGTVHLYNNLIENVVSQGVHTRSYGQVLVQANVFRNVKEPISTYGFVIPDDSPINPSGDYEPDGFANAWNNLYINSGKNNITQIGNFTKVPYSFKPDAPFLVKAIVDRYSGVGKI